MEDIIDHLDDITMLDTISISSTSYSIEIDTEEGPTPSSPTTPSPSPTPEGSSFRPSTSSLNKTSATSSTSGSAAGSRISPVVIDLAEDDDDESDGFIEENVGQEVNDGASEVDEVADEITENAVRNIHRLYLQPFYRGWRREVVIRRPESSEKSAACDVYYFPPPHLKRKKLRSIPDVERFLAANNCVGLKPTNFIFGNGALGINNRKFEIVRRSSRTAKEKAEDKRNQKKKYWSRRRT